ncbi:hypothetical protein GYH30_015114 [Glycine max]|nr:hypothetical protein GYH30_015114 [Glycine max]
MFLNQELHEAAGTTVFHFPEARILEWFDHQSRAPSSSFSCYCTCG